MYENQEFMEKKKIINKILKEMSNDKKNVRSK